MIVISDKQGQLANRLFVFANFIAFAIEHKIQIVNPAFNEYAHYFQCYTQDILCAYPPQKNHLIKSSSFLKNTCFKTIHYFVRILEKSHFTKGYWHQVISIPLEQSIDLNAPGFLKNVSGKKLLFCKGWRYQNKHIAQYSPQIRKLFTPVDSIQKNIASLITKARNKATIIIGVHIRRGDYSMFENGRYYYEISAYSSLLKKVKALFVDKKVLFIICSNEQQNTSSFTEVEVLLANNHMVEDLYTLAACNYIIGPPSTYSMWASFYGQVPLYMIADPQKDFTLHDFKVYSATIQ